MAAGRTRTGRFDHTTERRRGRPWAVLGIGAALALAACVPGQGEGTEDPATETASQAEGPAELVIWTDPNRQVGFEMYQEENPEVDLQIETLPDDIESRLQLANQAGEGWPDMIVVKTQQMAAFADAPYEYSADISHYVPEDMLGEFSPAILDLCTDGDALYCINNDLSPLVLWYDKDLMEEFGYELPTTWEEFEALGLQLAEEHPGYIMGHIATMQYLPVSRCPMAQVVGDRTLQVDLEDPNCTRVFEMIDNMLSAGALSPLSANDPEFIADYASNRHLLMSVQPLHRGQYGFINAYEWPEGSVGIAPPLRWENEDEVHNYYGGGVAYAVSRHSEHLEAAAELAAWMATGPYQTAPETPTFPAYRPAQDNWIENHTDMFYVEDGELGDVVEASESQLSPYWDELNVGSIRSSYAQAVEPGLRQGESIFDLVPAWQELIVNEAQAAGWTVEEG
ncbi:carbohydrate ABC transporter substrate-binding protein [Ruania alkalisoli]|uniref:Carbohydrate ABC transporter substrate-binding protein n=1 Tax=Ruania alkalisoli TaxID=2779775 RepID=A0A7M1SUQ3_9MICO|nr:ABC transporter substrate-binding protein [Ruania alkalisoli]QOR70482.1 carbohydrate ABC transporter substrate-binding protein [Ruania alkalisoli]